MNRINSTWQIKPLNSFGIFLRGVSYKKGQLLKEKTLNSVFLLRANNIQEKLDLTDLQIVPKELSEGKIIQNNDILFAMSSGSRHIVGKNILLKNLQDFSFGAFCGLFRITRKELNPNFLDYFLKSDFYKKYIINCARGTNINNLRFSDLQRLLIPLPPLEIQKEIAARLDFSFDKIEKGIKYLKLAKENIIEYKQSMLKYAFDGKLTSLPMSNWIQTTFGECLQYEQPTKYIVKSTKYNENYKTPVLTAGKSFILGYTNETDGIFTETPVIIFDDFTTDTKFVDFNFKVKSSAMKILLPNGKADIKFLYYLMQTIWHRSDTHKRYWISEYSKIKILILPIETQKEIVSILDKSFESADNMLKYVEDSLDKAELLKRALLRDAFNGKI